MLGQLQCSHQFQAINPQYCLFGVLCDALMGNEENLMVAFCDISEALYLQILEELLEW